MSWPRSCYLFPGHSTPVGRPHLAWMDTAMHDVGSLGHTLQIDLPRDWENVALGRDMWRGVLWRVRVGAGCSRL